MKKIWSVSFGLLLPVSFVSATTFTVNQIGDSGAGSLRQAMMDANTNAGTDTIVFNIPGAGMHTIAPLTELPHLTEAVLIDGFTQPGSSPNTLAIGNDAVLRIEISGVNLVGLRAFTIDAPGSTIRGLVINRVTGGASIDIESNSNTVTGNFIGTDPSGTLFLGGSGTAVRMSGNSNTLGGAAPAARNVIVGGGSANSGSLYLAFGDSNVIQGNYIGINAAGTAALQPAGSTSAIDMFVATNNTIGGTTVAARNVILGTQVGINLNSGAANNVIQGNLFGTNATGTAGLGAGSGISTANGPSGNTIGGSASGAGNVISGGTAGIFLADGASATTIQGNRIGTDATGTLPIPNSGTGIQVQVASLGSIVGGPNPGEGNTIAFNRGAGVSIANGASIVGWAIRGNSIHSNGGLGIDLNNDNVVLPNDDGDADAGCNGLQNFPIITSIAFGASTTTIQGVMNSVPSTTFDVDFFASAACAGRPQEFVEGETFLGTRPVTTDGTGNATFDFVLPVAVAADSRMSATATDPAGNTSEFSQRIIFSSSPVSGPASGGTALTFSGMLFVGPATATIGGIPATGVVVNGSGSISAVAPARPPGTVSDITVTVGSGLSGTLPLGYVADFLDVPPGPFNPFVGKLVGNLITAGCGGGNYCPGDSITRAQMAVFLLRGFNGVCFVPPPATGTVFADVPANSFAAAWVEALAAAQVTGGCGSGNYCPANPVTREQMSVFLLRMAGGPAYVPPACVTPTFNDVPCSSPFSPWIEELVRRGTTAGCGGGNYCPSSPVNRGQMAVFLSTTFDLP